MNDLLEQALEAASLAGAAIMNCYQQQISSELKHDGSPLTIADQEAHRIIMDYLAPSGLAVVSEEGGNLHLNAKKYWLVDPLDGTKDFLAGNNEFTVNIALMDRDRPLFGVVFAPAIGDIYWGGKHMGAWRLRDGQETALLPQPQSSICRMAISRFHNHPDVDVFVVQNEIKHRIPIGSALKYCLLACSDIDIFPRLVGSSEWDTAAGQAVLEAAGGQVLDWGTCKPLSYAKVKRRNPRLLALRSPYKSEDFVLEHYKDKLL
jgi:3'(2'), 5'-bisphosphate nucleotidase